MKHNKRVRKTTGEKYSVSLRVLSRNGDVHGRVIESSLRFDGQKYEATGKWYKTVYDVLPDGTKSKRLVTQK